jgi:class 3 adenylate cyclase
MARGDVKRKLTTIFSSDVEGYSRLMGEHEPATVKTLTFNKETMGKLIRQHKGQGGGFPRRSLYSRVYQCG